MLDEHIDTYGEVLSHILFGDLTRFVLQAYKEGDKALVERCLIFLDKALTDGDAEVQNLVAVSFVENTDPRDQASQLFISTWPEHLRAEAERQRDWRPEAPLRDFGRQV